MKQRDPYSAVGWLATIAVPIGPAFFFGWSIFSEVEAQTTGLLWLAVPVGILSAFGLEATGILAGHLLIEFANHRHDGRAILAGLILAAYTGLGVIHLWGSAGVIMFLIAPLIYLLVALRHTITAENQARQIQDGRKQQADREQREHQRQLDLEQMRLKHQEKMARIQAKNTTSSRQQPRQDNRQDTGNLPEDWRQLTDRQRRELAHATREEREEMFPDLAGRTRRAWHSRLDELAVQNGRH